MNILTIPSRTLGAVIVGGALVYFVYGHTPRSLVLDADCEPQSFVNRVRAGVQGERFWRVQLVAVDKQIAEPAKMRAARIRIESELGPKLAAMRQRTDSLEAQLPEGVRRSLVPDSLRAAADQMETDLALENLQTFLDNFGRSLLACRPKVAMRARIDAGGGL